MHGQSFPSVVRQPFHWTAYAFLLIAERERIEAPLKRLERARLAQRMAVAMSTEARRLWQEEQDILREMERGSRDDLPLEELIRIAKEMQAKVAAGTPVPIEQS